MVSAGGDEWVISPGWSEREKPAWLRQGAGAVPARFDAQVDRCTLPGTVQLRVRVHPVRGPLLKELTVSTRGVEPQSETLSTEAMRAVNPSGLVREAVQAATRPVEQAGDYFRVEGEDPNAWYGGPSVGPGRGNRISDDLLRRVASVYRRALGEGFHPTKLVAAELPCSRSSAGRWVELARKRVDPETGKPFLGPTRGTRPGELPMEDQ